MDRAIDHIAAKGQEAGLHGAKEMEVETQGRGMLHIHVKSYELRQSWRRVVAKWQMVVTPHQAGH